MATLIKWPAKYRSFYKTVNTHSKIITTGTLVAIDPASGSGSFPGYAIFKKGKLVSSGTIKINSKLPLNLRLHALYDQLAMLEVNPDVLVIEEIRGRMAHAYLSFAVGMTITAVRSHICIEIPINVWKAYVGRDHIKTDEADAIAMGEAIIELTKRLP